MNGRKYPLGIQTFETIIREGYVYVDKTARVYQLTHDNKYVFLSRPRRFGKSLLTTTIQAYFEGKKELFKGLDMEGLEHEWRKHPVLHFDLSCNKYFSIGHLHSTLNTLLETYEKDYCVMRHSEDTFSERLLRIIRAAKELTGENVVVLIDEYDAPMHDSLGQSPLQETMRNTMRSFFSPLKSEERNLRFVFLTGISKFSQLSIFSELNNLTNISLTDDYSDICGISKEELLRDFRPDMEALALHQGLSTDEAEKELKALYDGYHFSARGKDMFNPYSLLHTFQNNEFGNYWFATGTPTFLIDLLQKHGINLLELEDIECTADRFDVPTEQMTDPVPVLYQSGYLTIKGTLPGIRPYLRRYKLGFPNEEVRRGFSNSLYRHYAPDGIGQRDAVCRAYMDHLVTSPHEDMEGFMPHLQTFYKKFPYPLVNNNERHYQAVLYTIFLLLGCDVRPEVPTADGRIDLVLRTARSIYVFELKCGQSAESAMKQMAQKDYAAAFADEGKRIYEVGVNFSQDHRTMESWSIRAL